jgi:hypothetical protein
VVNFQPFIGDFADNKGQIIANGGLAAIAGGTYCTFVILERHNNRLKTL